MTAPRPRAEIVADRLTVTLALGEAHSRHQRAQASAGGAQISVLAVEHGRVETSGAEHLSGARAEHKEANDKMADAQAQIDALEARLAEIDEELARSSE